MKVLEAVGKYLWRLMAVWVIGLFLLALDVFGGVEKLVPGFALQQWVYPAVFALSFVVANAYLYVRQELEKQSLEDRIVELEALEAEICLKTQGEPEVGIAEHTIDGKGLPDKGTLQVILEFENIGHKPGELIWELDRVETVLPFPFELDSDDDGGFNVPLHTVDGQERTQRYLIVPLRIAAKDPAQFARSLNSLESYSVVVRYLTKRIGGTSPQQKLVVRGNFQRVRQKMRLYLEKQGFDDLAELIDSG